MEAREAKRLTKGDPVRVVFKDSPIYGMRGHIESFGDDEHCTMEVQHTRVIEGASLPAARLLLIVPLADIEYDEEAEANTAPTTPPAA